MRIDLLVSSGGAELKDNENNESRESRRRRRLTDSNLPALGKTHSMRRKRSLSPTPTLSLPKAPTKDLMRAVGRLMDEVPEIRMSGGELRRLGLDHRGGYLLSLVDTRCLRHAAIGNTEDTKSPARRRRDRYPVTC